jgi:hypothetical protein
MRRLGTVIVSLILLAELAAAQSLGDLARKERERKAAQQKPVVSVETDALRKGKVELAPPLDPARKGDLDYLLQQLSNPRPTPELLAAFVPLKAPAMPKLLPMLLSTDPIKRVAPAVVLTVLGKSDGLAAMARMLDESIVAAAQGAAGGGEAAAANVFQERMEATREASLALDATRLGVWRFTEGSGMAPEQVVQRIRAGPAIEVVGGLDNGQRTFSHALRDPDVNLRLGAVALIRAATGGKDFGYQTSASTEENEAAIQEITTFLTTERARVVAALATKRR